MAGILMETIDAGAGLGLPSSTALPTLTLALEIGLEAALLNKFLATAALQRGRKKTSPQKSNWQLEPDALA